MVRLVFDKVLFFIVRRLAMRARRLAYKRAFKVFMRYPTQEIATISFPRLKLTYHIKRDSAIAYMLKVSK